VPLWFWRAALAALRALPFFWGFAAGAAAGSFLDAVAWRVPRGVSVLRPPSRCDACGRRLGASELVPVLSWVWLRGRCRGCGAAIGWRPLVVEAVAGAAVVLCVWRFGPTWLAVARAGALVALVGAAAMDASSREVHWLHGAAGAAWVAACLGLSHSAPWRAAAVGAAATALVAAVPAALGRAGWGDVVVAPLVGGSLGAVAGLAAWWLAALFGAVWWAARVRRNVAMPFVPFLAAGSLAVVSAWPLVTAFTRLVA